MPEEHKTFASFLNGSQQYGTTLILDFRTENENPRQFIIDNRKARNESKAEWNLGGLARNR